MAKGNGKGTVRYVLVGAGHIAQVAVLPAFEQAQSSKIVGLVTSDDEKRKVLADRHGIDHAGDYDDFEQVCREANADAVYIALPNHLHCEWTERAAKAGLHVLCEKPMAVSEEECDRMHRVCEDAGVKLMIAYRLHFEPANMEAAARVCRTEIGNPRYFVSSFSMEVKEGDIRLNPIEKGGGTVYDVGIYCINAARYLFRAEPEEVVAFSASKGNDPRFKDCDEMTSVAMRFPGDRIASFTSSFGAASTSTWMVVGDKGTIRMDPAYGYALPLTFTVEKGEEKLEKTFPKHDQFAPELLYFSDCILHDEEPEPGWLEGKADIRIIRAIYESARTGKAVKIEKLEGIRYPDVEQVIERPGIEPPEPVHESSPSGD